MAVVDPLVASAMTAMTTANDVTRRDDDDHNDDDHDDRGSGGGGGVGAPPHGKGEDIFYTHIVRTARSVQLWTR